MAEPDNDKQMREEITPENCGQMLDLICKATGMALKDLAQYLGEKPSTLSHIRNWTRGTGGRKPSANFMNKLKAVAMIRPKGQHEQQASRAVTAQAVATGLIALARTKLLGSAAALTGKTIGIGLIGMLPAFGLLSAVVSICKGLGLSYREVKDTIEILRTSEDDEGDEEHTSEEEDE